MQKRITRTITGLCIGLCLLGVGVLGWAMPPMAQGPFATNTPASDEASPPTGGFPTNMPVSVTDPTASNSIDIFATNTPVGGAQATATPTPSGPSQSLFNYSLRLWIERDLIALAQQQIAAVDRDDPATVTALQLTLYELDRRFPQAPRDPAQRRQLIAAMVNAPAGLIDMRALVRPFVAEQVNQAPERDSLSVAGFTLLRTPANFNGDDIDDTLVNISYRDDDGALVYQDFILLIGREAGGFDLPPHNYALFAAPFGGVRDIILPQVVDANRDTLDEVLLQVIDNEPNRRLVPVAFRNGQVIEIVEAPRQIRFIEQVSFPIADPDVPSPELRVITARRETTPPDWPCLSEIEFVWAYDRNLYRRSLPDLNARFSNQDSLACALLEADQDQPIFSRIPSDARLLIENTLLEYGFDADGADRALMTLAMIYALEGRVEDARNTAQSIIPADQPDAWAAQQATALIVALEQPNLTGIDICETLAQANPAPACDMNPLLGRTLDVLNLTTDEDLIEQLENFSLPIANVVVLDEVGRAQRTAVQFDLADTTWWGFTAGRDGFYTAQPIPTPEGFEVIPAMASDTLQLPPIALSLLVREDDPAAALNILENVQQNNPQGDFSAQALYAQALAHELIGAREDARQTYYAVWLQYPDTIWGNLARQHLELR